MSFRRSHPFHLRAFLGFAVLAVVGGSVLAWAPQTRTDLLPSIRGATLISDRVTGGASDVFLDSVSRGIRFRYVLPPGEGRPWAGVKLEVSDPHGRAIDLTHWDRLEVKASSSHSRPVRIQLLSDDAPPGATSRDSLQPIYHVLEFRPDGTPKTFPWTTFWIPIWWQAQKSRTDIQRLELLDRLRAIEFHSGDSPGGGGDDVVEIQELNVVGTNRVVNGLGWIGLVVGLVGAMVSLGVARLGRQPETGGSVLVPDPVAFEDPRVRQRNQLLQALRETFPDPDLSLDSFSASQGLSPRLVASLIKEATQLHFKGALNELRLTEAARLLKETRGNVSEIAYAVGFQNPSHFGRAFREKHGVSPTDYRAGGKSPVPEDPTLQN